MTKVFSATRNALSKRTELGAIKEMCFATQIPDFAAKNGGAGESRTPDTQFRKLLLYPSELQPRLKTAAPNSLTLWRSSVVA